MSVRDVRQIVAFLEAHGSPEHAAGVQWFFKEAIRSHGWRTADLRLSVREQAPRLVLRTACERLPPSARARILR